MPPLSLSIVIFFASLPYEYFFLWWVGREGDLKMWARMRKLTHIFEWSYPFEYMTVQSLVCVWGVWREEEKLFFILFFSKITPGALAPWVQLIFVGDFRLFLLFRVRRKLKLTHLLSRHFPKKIAKWQPIVVENDILKNRESLTIQLIYLSSLFLRISKEINLS